MKDYINKKIVTVLKRILGDNYAEVLELQHEMDDQVLHIILSESSQALNMVITLEEEFDIEFDDDEVDINFFMSFQKIVSLIEKHKRDNYATP